MKRIIKTILAVILCLMPMIIYTIAVKHYFPSNWTQYTTVVFGMTLLLELGIQFFKVFEE